MLERHLAEQHLPAIFPVSRQTALVCNGDNPQDIFVELLNDAVGKPGCHQSPRCAEDRAAQGGMPREQGQYPAISFLKSVAYCVPASFAYQRAAAENSACASGAKAIFICRAGR